jgi:hypothetical protein
VVGWTEKRIAKTDLVAFFLLCGCGRLWFVLLLGCGLGWFLFLGWFLGFVGVWEQVWASLLCMGVCWLGVVVGVGYVEKIELWA